MPNAPAGDDATFKNEQAAPVVGGGLPAVIPFAPLRKTWRSRFLIGAFAVLLAAGGAGFYWWKHSQSLLPAGISFGNGRLEADEIDISTKFPGRVAELHAEIGDMVPCEAGGGPHGYKRPLGVAGRNRKRKSSGAARDREPTLI
jgi:HlyD family secretion protein